MTGTTTSELAQLADIILSSVSHDPLAETVSSRITQYSLIHTIYINLALRQMEATVENERETRKALTSDGPFLSLRKKKE